MPVYTYKQKKYGTFDRVMTIDEMEKWEAANPDAQRIFKTVRLSYEGDGVKIDSGFRDILKKIKKDSPGNTITIPGVK